MIDLTICVPVYNAELFLETSIKSLLTQSIDSMEIIVIDDGSKDNSWEIICRIANQDPRVKCFKQTNVGAATTRNRCLKMLNSRWVIFFDADDYLYPKSLDAMLFAAKNNPGKIVSAVWTKFTGTPAAVADVWKESIQPNASGVDWLLHRWLRTSSCTYPGSFLIPTALIREQTWNEKLTLMDDTPFYTEAIVKSAGVVQVGDAVFGYREPGPKNLSHQMDVRHVVSALTATRLANDILLKAEYSSRTRLAAANQLMWFAYSHFLDHRALADSATTEAESLARATLRPPGGILRKLLTRVVGWRRGLRWHRILKNGTYWFKGHQ